MIDKEIKKNILKKNNMSYDNDLLKLEEAERAYDDMVKKGLIRPRGYQLLGIDDAYLHREYFNTPNTK